MRATTNADNFNGACDKMCPLECDTELFKVSLSSKNFPSTYYGNYLIRNKQVFQEWPLNRLIKMDDVMDDVM